MKKKKILFDCSTCHVCHDSILIEILSSEYDVLLLTTEKKKKILQQQFSDISIKYFVKDEYSGPSRFRNLNRGYRNALTMKKIIDAEKPEFVLINSIFDNSYIGFLGFLRVKIPVILFLHDIHAWSFVRDYPIGRLKLLARKRLLKKTQAVFFTSDYLLDKKNNAIENRMYVFPFRLSESEDIEKRKEYLKENKRPTFVIPGAVSKVTRDYSWVFEMLKGINYDFELILLGRVDDPSIVEEAKLKLGDKVRYFTGYIEESAYKKLLLKSHAIIGNCSETLPYGKYKSSGVEFDGPANAIPVILKRETLSNCNHGLFIRFDDMRGFERELGELVKHVNEGTYDRAYLKPAILESAYFSKEKWQGKLFNILRELGGRK